jgi:hypothetical protein
MDTLLGLVSMAGFLFFLLIIVLCSYQLRRWKYQQIANELGAEYQSQGLFKMRKIAGSSNHRRPELQGKMVYMRDERNSHAHKTQLGSEKSSPNEKNESGW